MQLANAAAAFVLGVACAASGIRLIEDVKLVFIDAPRSIVPAGHQKQVDIVREKVPRGSTLIFLMDTLDSWQFGLWQRSLYPDYKVFGVVGMNEFDSKPMQDIIQKEKVYFVLSTGNPPLQPAFAWEVALPAYPASPPVNLGRIGTP